MHRDLPGGNQGEDLAGASAGRVATCPSPAVVLPAGEAGEAGVTVGAAGHDPGAAVDHLEQKLGKRAATHRLRDTSCR